MPDLKLENPLDARQMNIVTVQEYSVAAGQSEVTTRRQIASGELKAYRLGQRMIRLDLNDLERMLTPILRTSTPGASSLMASGDVFTKVS